MEPVSSKEFLDIQAAIECRFTLKRVRDMRIACSRLDVFISCAEFIPFSVSVVSFEQVNVGCV